MNGLTSFGEEGGKKADDGEEKAGESEGQNPGVQDYMAQYTAESLTHSSSSGHPPSSGISITESELARCPWLEEMNEPSSQNVNQQMSQSRPPLPMSEGSGRGTQRCAKTRSWSTEAVWGGPKASPSEVSHMGLALCRAASVPPAQRKEPSQAEGGTKCMICGGPGASGYLVTVCSGCKAIGLAADMDIPQVPRSARSAPPGSSRALDVKAVGESWHSAAPSAGR